MTNYLGKNITKFDAKPAVAVDARLHGGYNKGAVDTFELAATSDDDTVMVFRLPVEAIVKSLKFGCDDLGTAGVVSLGLFTKGNDGDYKVVKADAFADDVDVNSAAVPMTEMRFEKANISTITDTAWQLAGLTKRPAYSDLYVGITVTTGTTATGTVSLEIVYSE